jgi:predicted phosphodiesterase
MPSSIKIGIVSDLHSEFWSLRATAIIGGKVAETLAEADLILLAGDIGNGSDGLVLTRSLFPTKPIFMVAGNHEFYQRDYDQVISDLQAATDDNTHFLHQSVGEITIGDTPIRIIGTTLWTDFNLHGGPDLSLFDAGRGLNDFQLIHYKDRILTPHDTLDWHTEQRAWLLATLDVAFDGITIVMTHHAPVSFAISSRFKGDNLSPCFASRMEELLLRDDLPLVVWGHTHHCVDRVIDTTRFVSNQTGYAGGRWLTETGQFGQIVELSR